jgi:predicted Zn-dependent peptidase
MIKRSFYSLVLISVFAAFGVAQDGKAIGTPHQAAAVTEFDANGLKVIVKRRPSATVAVGLFIRGGARNINAKNAGIENLMLNVATEGSKKYPRQALRRELARTGSSISSGSNQDYSVFSLVATRQNFDRLWDVFVDITLNPTFAPEDVARIKSQLLTGLRERESDPDNALEAAADRIVYAGHPYANDVSGTIATVGAFTPADLQAYHQKVTTASQMLLVVVGDVDPETFRQRVTTSFAALPKGSYKESPLPTLNFTNPTLDVSQRSLQTNYIKGVFPAPTLGTPDFYAMRVATMILRDRVFEEVRTNRQLSYAPSADLDNFEANSGNIYVTAVDANQAVKIMLGEIKDMRTSLVSQQSLDAVAGTFLTTYYVGQETNAAQAGELARYELIGGGWRNAFEFLNRIRQVTPEQVREVSNKYMKNLRFAVVGDPSAIDRTVFLQGQSE